MSLNLTNLDRLISHLEGLPEERFSMKHLITHENDCGTVACIAGWCNLVGGVDHYWADAITASKWLSISDNRLRDTLFCPDGFYDTPEIYPLSRAIRTLKHMRSEYLRTGQVVVDWDAPEPVERKPWAAPVAQEKMLPAELTQLLGSPLATSEVL